MASETRSLLQSRLRAAFGVILVGFSLFLIRGFFVSFPLDIRVLHLLVMGFLVASIILLTVHNFRLVTLRWYETVSFVGIHGYLLATLVIQLDMARLEDWPVMAVNSIKSTMLFTLILTTIYCMFVPNRWQRAAMMVAFFVISPGITLGVLRTFVEDFETFLEPIATVENITENELILLTAAVVAVFGTAVINRLRGEVFEARQFGQYRLGARIGSGGMGEVFLGEHQLMRRPCAIKVIRPERASDQSNVDRFAREVRASARLTHWNTVEVYDYGKTDDGVFFYVMELLNGLSFQELGERCGPLPPARAIYLICQICEALEEAELVHLVHRDIKPSNLFTVILGGRHDVAKLTDFGLVKSMEPFDRKDVTQEGRISGSPLYMSPEQSTGKSPDHRSDIYSLGAVMYFLLTGQPPFNGTNALEVMVAHARDPVPALETINPGLPRSLADVVMKCLAKDPADRFQSAKELKHALENVETDERWNQALAAAWWSRLDTEMLRLIQRRTSSHEHEVHQTQRIRTLN